MTLRETQSLMAAALMRPLGSQDPITSKAARLIKPNDRLTSRERLEIYSRSYWSRLLDSLRDDFPGLMAILGPSAFDRLAKAYLLDCPSTSYSLRDLGSRLEEWLSAHPERGDRNRALALDMAKLEWAHIAAFDGPAEAIAGPEYLMKLDAGLRLGVQPYIGLLRLQYPVDELRIQVNAGDVIDRARVRRLVPEPIYLAVHRSDLSVYYRRLRVEELRLLEELRAGHSITRSIQLAFKGSPAGDAPVLLEKWFAAWSNFGWLTVRKRIRRGTKLKS